MCNSGYLQNKAFISFIVPVYNACQTLSLCADSHRSQGLAEDAFEIILVNDGSADVSGALCEGFSFMFVSSWLILRSHDRPVFDRRHHVLSPVE